MHHPPSLGFVFKTFRALEVVRFRPLEVVRFRAPEVVSFRALGVVRLLRREKEMSRLEGMTAAAVESGTRQQAMIARADELIDVRMLRAYGRGGL